MNKILLIGNVIYESERYEKLPSVEQDIETMEEIFGNLNYEVTKHLNLKYTEMLQALEEFEKSISDTDNVIAYYSGHGFHKNGRNFVLACDTKSMVSANMNSEYLEEFYDVVDVEKLTELARWNVNGNTLIIIDACRSEGMVELGPLKEAFASANIAWQLFSTSLGKSSFANGLFVKAIEKVIYRDKQNVSDLFESIRCFMENNCAVWEYQAPVLICGKKSFCVVEKLNAKVEAEYYDELMKMYLEVRQQLKNYEYPYTDEIITQIANDINAEFCRPIAQMKDKVRHISRYSREMGIINLLIDEELVEVNVYEDRIRLHGLCSNYTFENMGLYAYDNCWEYINLHSCIVDKFRYKYGKVTCINFGPCSSEKVFTVIVKKGKKDLSYYIDEYYRSDTEKISNLYIAMDKIISNKSSVLIVGKRHINLQSFIHSLLCQYLLHYSRVCELVHLTQMGDTAFSNTIIEYEQLFTDITLFQEFIGKIKKKHFDWIIIPLTAYHECTFKDKEMQKLLDIEKIAKENQSSLIFYTDFLDYAVPIIHITKQALSFAEYAIYLEQDEQNKQAYVQAIIPIE